ncbi:hypothetical protein ABZ467_34335 [Streptomyces sp. NPDC005727]
MTGDPDVVDFRTLQAAVPRHADKVINRPVYAQIHHHVTQPTH